MNKDRVPYVKSDTNLKTGKLIGTGGPRDVQRRQQNRILNAPKFNDDDLEKLKNMLQEQISSISSTDGNSNEETERKISDAIKAVRDEEAKRYESGIKNINDQLNAAKVKLNLMNIEIEKRDAQIKELENLKTTNIVPDNVKNKLTNYELEISRLNKELILKEKALNDANIIISNLKIRSEQSDSDLVDMKNTINLMLDKLSNLQVGVISKDTSIPSIDEHKVFIDPSENNEDLKSHIDVVASSIVSSRDLKSDVDKLRKIVGENKYKPTKVNSIKED